jgi:acyl carrier protein
VSDRAPEVLAEIRRIAATELGITFPVEPGHELARDLHLDSVSAVVLAVGLEDHFEICLSESDTAGLRTVEDLVRRVNERIEQEARP